MYIFKLLKDASRIQYLNPDIIQKTLLKGFESGTTNGYGEPEAEISLWACDGAEIFLFVHHILDPMAGSTSKYVGYTLETTLLTEGEENYVLDTRTATQDDPAALTKAIMDILSMDWISVLRQVYEKIYVGKDRLKIISSVYTIFTNGMWITRTYSTEEGNPLNEGSYTGVEISNGKAQIRGDFYIDENGLYNFIPVAGDIISAGQWLDMDQIDIERYKKTYLEYINSGECRIKEQTSSQVKKLQAVLHNDERLKQIYRYFLEQFYSEDTPCERVFQSIISKYLSMDDEGRRAMDDVLLSLCGWTLLSLNENSKQ
jgi:hypothetical protein